MLKKKLDNVGLKSDVKLKSDTELKRILQIDQATLDKFKAVQKAALAEAKLLNRKKSGKIRVLGISSSARSASGMAKEKSNSEQLLEKSLDYCKKLGAETKLISLREYDIKPCQACYSTANTHCHFSCSCYPKGTPAGDDMSNKLYDEVLWAEVIIFATPVNNFKISSLLADFIDRCISLDGSLTPADKNNPKNRELNIKQMKFIELTADSGVPGSGLLRRFLGKVAGIIVTGHEAGASLTISSLFMTLHYYGMIFPPFSSVYAMSSICNSTYQDKPIVTSKCYDLEIEMQAKNLITAAKLSRQVKPTDWKYNCGAN
ncbi:flavodoxin family protein [Candidatus Woesearchaeota archaeon]|nr:flavodoxin family protein [Candidatus Woesearchaeota archaeon]